MPEYTVNVLVVEHSPEWKKWPDTEDEDYTSVHEGAWTNVHEQGDIRIVVNSHYYPIYEAFSKTGHSLSEGVHPLAINNLRIPPSKVIDQIIADLHFYGKDCQILSWPHLRHCYAPVAGKIKEIFNFAVFCFCDDCPQSSEYKSFPAAHGFDVGQYQMYIWDYTTGVLTGDRYKEFNLANPVFSPPRGGTSYFSQYLAEDGFTEEKRLHDIREGALPVGLVYVGANGYPNPLRCTFLDLLNEHDDEIEDLLSKPLRLWGYRMRDGVLGERNVPVGDGFFVAPEYNRSLFTINYPVSSLFNARLLDCWEAGVIQLIPDIHNELDTIKARDGEHFIKFDGSFDDMREKLAIWKDRPLRLANIAAAGFKKAREVKQMGNLIQNDFYFSFLKQILNGR